MMPLEEWLAFIFAMFVLIIFFSTVYNLEKEHILKERSKEFLFELQQTEKENSLDQFNHVLVYKDVLNKMIQLQSHCVVLRYPYTTEEVREDVIKQFESLSFDNVKFTGKQTKGDYMLFTVEYLGYPYSIDLEFDDEYNSCKDLLKDLFL
jgi:hypothetical protein